MFSSILKVLNSQLFSRMNTYIATTHANTKVQQITLNLRNDAFLTLLQLTLLEFKTFLLKMCELISIFEVGRE
jgi:hypothetical protein